GDVLRALKREHEQNCAEKQRNATIAGLSTPDLIAIGPNIVFVGEFLGLNNAEWSWAFPPFLCNESHESPHSPGEFPGDGYNRSDRAEYDCLVRQKLPNGVGEARGVADGRAYRRRHDIFDQSLTCDPTADDLDNMRVLGKCAVLQLVRRAHVGQ